MTLYLSYTRGRDDANKNQRKSMDPIAAPPLASSGPSSTAPKEHQMQKLLQRIAGLLCIQP